MTKLTALALGEALLAATFETTIAKAKTFQIKLEDFPLEAALALMQYGVGRKFNDAVGGSDKDAATKLGLVEGMLEDWKAGRIGRQTAASVPQADKVRRSVVRELFLRVAPDARKLAFKELDAEAQGKMLDEIFAKQTEAKQADIMADVARRIAEAEAKAAQAAKLAEAIEL